MRELSEYQDLPLPERLELVSAIGNSIFRDLGQLPLPAGLREDLERELEEYRKDPSKSRSWDEVDRELFGRD